MPEHHLKYLMAHSRGKAALVRYTRVRAEKVCERYEAAVEREWPGLLDVIRRRSRELGMVAVGGKPERRS